MSLFRFKKFSVDDADCAMKVGTDSVLLGAWADVSQVRSVIDVGTGSGLLALMIAQRAPEASIIGIEADFGAYSAACHNFDVSPWPSRLEALCADAFEFCPAEKVDLIVCNPPYFTVGLLSPDPSRAAARHSSGQLGPVSVVRLASSWLNDSGSLAMVTPADYIDDIIYAAEMLRLHVWRKCLVKTVASKQPSRVLWQISRSREHRYTETSLTLRDKGLYTPEYAALTLDFYL